MRAFPAVVAAVLISGSTPAVAAVSPDYPLILDVDVTAVCGQPSTGRVTFFNPANKNVEWRIRQNGAVITGTGTDFALPGRGEFLVDAREPGRAYGKVWHDEVPDGCDPVRVVSVGDSVVWNQGVDQHQKFPRLTASLLGKATGRGFVHRDYSISGAVLDAPDVACPGEYVQDPDGDGEMELGEVTAQLPDVFCQLDEAAQAKTDLVIINGCINDMDPLLGIPLGITPGTEDVPAAVRRECGGVGAAPTNPARDVPYFSGAKVGYGGRGMRDAIEKAHSLPGRPKVLVVDFYYALSRASFVPRWFCTDRGFSARNEQLCLQNIGRAPQRFEQFTRESAEAYRTAVAEANAASADGPFAVVGDGLFTLDNAAFAADRKVWQLPHEDEQFSLRQQACPRYSATAVQCLTAAVAHPDTTGSRQYAENFLRNQQLRAWFGLDSAQATIGVERSGDTVTLQAPAGSDFRWYFGDGTSAAGGRQVTHTYTTSGPHLPRVVVDGRLHEARDSVRVKAGT
ncbi:PKD domain-containing protein [Lentzea aerocolonigenes]|uniref:PKD domain-containing protein n=1 Tax=Lentzea aerocolonigenes TaxID=68170 RepID=UPI0005EC4738|nr:hypothetical protein [Lentzea aerocolonigenes]